MAAKRQPILHDNILGGVDTTTPAHMLGADKWRSQHNWRLTPTLQQIPRKLSSSTWNYGDIMWLGVKPMGTSGYGRLFALTPSSVGYVDSTPFTQSLVTDSNYRRWAVAAYNDLFFYTNELNPIRYNNGSNDGELSGILKVNGVTTSTRPPAARYMVMWFDHIVVGYPTYENSVRPNRVMMSNLYRFQDTFITGNGLDVNLNAWKGAVDSEAASYDVVEWQQPDYPFTGITGLGVLNGTLWVYTATAIVPFEYVGMPKVFQINDKQVIKRVGNSFPWTLVTLGNVHFFYDGLEKMFFSFDGQSAPQPIGEPVRKYLQDTLSNNLALAMKMYGYIDVDNREIWWPFVSKQSGGAFDKAVVFNYRYAKWYTASVENVLCFGGGGISTGISVGALVGLVSALTGSVGSLGLGSSTQPRLFGSASGALLREETVADTGGFITADDPVLETPDFHYGDIRTAKENDVMYVNAVWPAITAGFVTATSVVLNAGVYTITFPSTAGRRYKWTPATQDISLTNGAAVKLNDNNDFYLVAAGSTIVVLSTNGFANILAVDPSYFNVEVSVRDYLGTSPQFTTVGVWFQDLQDSALSYPAKAGRILRYRFTGKNMKLATFSAFSDLVLLNQAER